MPIFFVADVVVYIVDTVESFADTVVYLADAVGNNFPACLITISSL